MRIRVLVPADAEAFQALRLLGLQTSETAFSSSYLEEANRPLQEVARRLGTEESCVFGAFAEDGQLVGVTGLYREPRMKTGHKATIWGMYVAPEYRRQGIGRALLEEAVSHARELAGVRQVNLTVVTSNQAARSLYVSSGFEEFGLERSALHADGEYYDMTHMALHFEQRA